MAEPCPVPPAGWACTRGYGHEGPCAAVKVIGSSIEVPELHAVALAYARVKEIESLRGAAGNDLALACYEASEVASAGLIARTIGVSRPRVAELIDKGRALSGHRKPKKKGRFGI